MSCGLNDPHADEFFLDSFQFSIRLHDLQVERLARLPGLGDRLG